MALITCNIFRIYIYHVVIIELVKQVNGKEKACERRRSEAFEAVGVEEPALLTR